MKGTGRGTRIVFTAAASAVLIMATAPAASADRRPSRPQMLSSHIGTGGALTEHIGGGVAVAGGYGRYGGHGFRPSYGHSYGRGHGFSPSYGYGHGHGFSPGYGYGHGHGFSPGYGYGQGHGFSPGYGYGYGHGFPPGYGYGRGFRPSYGYGYGPGFDGGHLSGVLRFGGHSGAAIAVSLPLLGAYQDYGYTSGYYCPSHGYHAQTQIEFYRHITNVHHVPWREAEHHFRRSGGSLRVYFDD